MDRAGYVCLTKLCLLPQKKGQSSASVVTLTVHNKAGDPTQVDVESNTQMIDMRMLLQDAGPAKETLRRLCKLHPKRCRSGAWESQ